MGDQGQKVAFIYLGRRERYFEIEDSGLMSHDTIYGVSVPTKVAHPSGQILVSDQFYGSLRKIAGEVRGMIGSNGDGIDAESFEIAHFKGMDPPEDSDIAELRKALSQ
jgi:hypothetical protein